MEMHVSCRLNLQKALISDYKTIILKFYIIIYSAFQEKRKRQGYNLHLTMYLKDDLEMLGDGDVPPTVEVVGVGVGVPR